MIFRLFLSLLLVGCSEHSGRAVPLDAQPEIDADYVLRERMEEHFGGRVSIEDLGEFEDGEHFSVIHDGAEYVVVYDVDQDRIISATKAGTLQEGM